jgi:GYF domain 2
MQIYINKNGQQIGSFAEDKILEMLVTGELSPDDLAIRQGEKSWTKLETFFLNNEQNSTESIPTNSSNLSNHRVADWAKQNITEPLNADVEWWKYIFLSFAFFALAIFFILGIIALMAQNSDKSMANRVFGGILCDGVLFIPIMILFYYAFRSFRKRIKFIDSKGVVTVVNKRFNWGNLYYVNYAVYSVRTQGRRLPKKLRMIELVFENGRVEMGVSNMKVRELLERIPIQPKLNELFSEKDTVSHGIHFENTISRLSKLGVNIRPD